MQIYAIRSIRAGVFHSWITVVLGNWLKDRVLALNGQVPGAVNC